MDHTASNLIKMLLLLLVCSLSGCQQDEDEIITPPADQVIDSEMTDLLKRISLKDGSSDNIIDRASCITLVFPLKVSVNGIKVALNNIDDLGIVEDILDELIDDDDKIEIQFPINVILENYGKIKVENKSDLNDLIKNCVEGGSDDDIECLDFNYPFEVALYKPDNQVADVITITSDEELYTFFVDLKNNDLANFIFPVSITLADGTRISVTDNKTLKDIIKNGIEDCDEDDDYDYHDDDDIDDDAFVTILTDGEWIITYFFEDGDDGTSDVEEFTFTFAMNGTFTAVNATTQVQGTWEIRDDDGKPELRLDIDDDDLDGLDENWKIMNFTSDKIRLRDSSGGNPTYLTFERP
jgi:hypothetical protein